MDSTLRMASPIQLTAESSFVRGVRGDVWSVDFGAHPEDLGAVDQGTIDEILSSALDL